LSLLDQALLARMCVISMRCPARRSSWLAEGRSRPRSAIPCSRC